MNSLPMQAWVAVAVTVFALTSAQANAATILGNSIDDGGDLQVAYVSSSSPLTADYVSYYAIGFTMPGQSYTLTNVSVRLSQYAIYAGNSAQFSIVQDGGQNNPYLASSTLVAFSPVLVALDIADYTLTPIGTVTLAANTKYWLLASPALDSEWFSWMTASDAPTGLATVTGFAHQYSSNSDPYGTVNYSYAQFNPRFAIRGELNNGASVPEPGTLALLGLGLVGLGFTRRRKA